MILGLFFYLTGSLGGQVHRSENPPETNHGCFDLPLVRFERHKDPEPRLCAGHPSSAFATPLVSPLVEGARANNKNITQPLESPAAGVLNMGFPSGECNFA